MKVLILDNYDSFVYNLVQYVGVQGAKTVVYRNDELSLKKIESTVKPDAIVISPGPGNPSDPKDFGVCGDVLKTLSRRVPTLGICLGHQGIGYAYGAKISHANVIMHGKTSKIRHDGLRIFKGMPSPIEATRYHSLVVKKGSVPAELEVTASSLDDGEIMALRHREYPIFGVQFHPESIRTSSGMSIIKNFLNMV
ncbi:MAG: anthranilate synthase component II [Nitrososphaerales archaeon]